MKKSTLIKWSVARDCLSFIGIGQIPGLCWLLDLPLFIMHFKYAGPVAIFTLFEIIPVVGFFPFFTVAALSYPDYDQPGNTGAAKRIGSARSTSSELMEPPKPPLYALVDGRLVPLTRSSDRESGLQDPIYP